MHCIERGRLRTSRVACLGVALLVGCAAETVRPPAPVTAARAVPASTAAPAVASAVAPKPVEARAAATQAIAAAATGAVRLAAPGPVRNWDELRLQAARRIVAANPHLTYAGRAPNVLLAIPVLSVDLNGDGSIRRIEVLRYPRQAKDTTQLAIDAVKRAAPFGDVSRLSRPWRFTETFLFNDARQFKPRILDEQ